MPIKIAVITDDVVTERMAGPAIRAWHLATELASHGHEVTLFSTRFADRQTADFTVTYSAVATGALEPLREVVAWADCVITQGYTTFFEPWILTQDKYLVVDLYDPIHIELLEAESAASPAEQEIALARAYDALDLQVEFGDFFICASQRQRDLWLGYLSAKRRLNFVNYRVDPELNQLIDLVPFGISNDDPPVTDGHVLRGVVPGIDADAEILLWAGGIYNWFDPVTLIRAVAELRRTRPSVHLVFMGVRHPLADAVADGSLRDAYRVAEELEVLGSHVHFLDGWVPYEQRHQYLLEADLGVSTHFVNAETAYSFRTRMLDYLWCGLPIVCTEGDEFAAIVAADELGEAVPARNVEALRAAIERLLADDNLRAQTRVRVRATAERYRWSSVVQPVVQYCAAPYKSPDGHPTARTIGPVFYAKRDATRRVRHVRAYVEINGWRRLIRRGTERTLAAGLRLVRRPRSSTAANDDPS
ncbi:glycosyltransferase [Epidermidibacterium keratini]|uniref:Glycosyltransferase n=1 Tax=Epidermidibacterium keratini TaxID=1891644 RepID=A0A7L4YNQ6_9ACTN|nr:glycosyltransferase family 4 protein [Epidermidibacterium keratini]QHC00708.1 glycosyltransferase [Epidermidibacterium keratini]